MDHTERIPIALVSVLLGVNGSVAQLNGTYHVGGATPDYLTLNEAFLACVSPGLAGPVVFELHDAVYTESLDYDMGMFTTVTATNSITVRSAANDPWTCTVQYANADTQGNWRIMNAHHIRFEGITWKNTSSTGHSLFELLGDLEAVRFNNNRFESDAGIDDEMILGFLTSAQGLHVEDNEFGLCGTGVGVYEDGMDNDLFGIAVANNTFEGGGQQVGMYHAIGARVDSNSFANAETMVILGSCDSSFVRGNSGSDISDYGIFVQGDLSSLDDHIISHNSIEGIAGSCIAGLYFSSCTNITCSYNQLSGGMSAGIRTYSVDHLLIEMNTVDAATDQCVAVEYPLGILRIQRNFLHSSSPGSKGISVVQATEPIFAKRITSNTIKGPATFTGISAEWFVGAPGLPALIANNQIIGGNKSLVITNSQRVDVVFNSMMPDDDMHAPVALLGLETQFANNVLSAHAPSYSFPVLMLASDPSSTYHNNIYHLNESAPGYSLSTAHSTLAAAQAAGSEIGSAVIDPLFIDPTSVLQPTEQSLDGMAVPAAAVANDIIGYMRDLLAPTPGAYEYIAVGTAHHEVGQVALFPVPFDDVLNIQLPDGENGIIIRLLDPAGRQLVIKEVNGPGPLALTGLSDLSSGVYIVECVYSSGIIQTTVVH